MTFAKMRSRLSAPLVALTLAGSALALPLAMAQDASALPRPVVGPPGASGESCYYRGQQYSDGSVVRMDNGGLYTCRNGSWVY